MRWAVYALLSAWAVWVAQEFQAHHPFPFHIWAARLSVMDWSLARPHPAQVVTALRDVLSAAAIVVAAACLGARAISWLWREPAAANAPGQDFATVTTRGERFWLAVVCGLAGFATVAIAFAAVGVLRRPVLLLVLAASGAGGAPTLWRMLRAPQPHADPDPYLGVRRAAVLVMVLGMVGVLPRALSPEVLFDAQVYHLAMPRVYLDAGRFLSFPNNVFTNAPHSMAMVYSYALSLGGAPVAKLLHAACGIGMLVLTAGIGRRLAGPTVGVLAALLTFATPLMIEHVATAYVDLAMGLAFTAALWAAWHGLATRHAGALRVAGLCLGFYAGIKYTALFGVVGLALAIAALLVRRRAPLAEWARTAAPFLVGLIVGAGPWLVKNALFVGNPLYPMATSLFGLGPRFASEVARTAEVVALHGMGRTLMDMVLLPWRITAFGAHGSPTFDGTILPLWLMAAPLLVLRPTRRGGRAFAAVAALGYFVAWAPVVHITRYLIPIFPVFSLLTVHALVRALPHAQPVGRRARLWLWGGFAATAFWWLPPIVSHAVWGWTAFAPAAWGQVAPDDFILHEEQTGPMYAWMDEHLPADAQVLGLWENRMYRCPRPLTSDGVFWASRWVDRFALAEDMDTFAAELRARGLTHVLFNAPFQEVFLPLSPDDADRQLVERGLARIHAFLAEQCDPLHEANGMRLYRIRGEGGVVPAGADAS